MHVCNSIGTQSTRHSIGDPDTSQMTTKVMVVAIMVETYIDGVANAIYVIWK